MSSNLVSVTTGHFACGRWHLKEENGIPYLSHPQPFSRRNEFRIGPDQVMAVTAEYEKGDDFLVKLDFTGERYCRAQIHKDLLPKLEAMVDDQRVIPLAKNQQTNWAMGLGLFFLVCILIELFK